MICGSKTVLATCIGVMVYIIVITFLYFSQDRKDEECLGNSTIKELKSSHDLQLVKLENEIRNEMTVSGSCLSVWMAYLLSVGVCGIVYICVHHRSRMMNISCCCFKVTTGDTATIGALTIGLFTTGLFTSGFFGLFTIGLFTS